MTDGLAAKVQKIVEERKPVYDEHDVRLNKFLSHIEQTDNRPAIGSVAPDFMLPDTGGRLVTFGHLTGERGLVLLFIQGTWCPYCAAQIDAFRDAYNSFQDMGMNLAIITPELNGSTSVIKQRHDLPFEVLCDVDAVTTLEYGCLFRLPEEDQKFYLSQGIDLREKYGSDAWFMPLASIFVLDNSRTVQAVYGESDQRWRVGPDKVIEGLAASAL